MTEVVLDTCPDFPVIVRLKFPKPPLSVHIRRRVETFGGTIELLEQSLAPRDSPEVTFKLTGWGVPDRGTMITLYDAFPPRKTVMFEGDTLSSKSKGAVGEVTVNLVVAEPFEPLLSVAVIVMVKVWDNIPPVLSYLWVSEVAVPGRLSGVDPSPQWTEKPAIVPVPPGSGSVAVKDTVTGWPVVAGFGERLVMVMVGGKSLIITGLWSEPIRFIMSVAVTVIVKSLLGTEPVER